MKIAMYVISDTRGGETYSIAFRLYFVQPLHIHSEYT